MKPIVTVFGALSVILASPSWAAATFSELAQMTPASYQVIDCRSSDQFNGWPEPGYSRGGHFPAAVNFDADWLAQLSSDAFAGEVSRRGLRADKPTYLYCDDANRKALEQKLRTEGFTDVKAILQKVGDYSGRLAALDKFQQLVPASWVKQLIDGDTPAYAPRKGYKIVEVAWGPPTKYLISHIPGALYLNTNNIESEPLWNRVDSQTLTQTLQELGIRYDTTVILYGRDVSAAARAANVMMYAGVEDVRLLNGGWQAWQHQQYATEALLNRADPVAFGKTIPADPEYIVDVPEAKNILADREHGSLVSIRSWPEYLGETSGYDYIDPKGRIPGSRWGHAGSDAHHMEDFHNPDGTMISADTIQAYWQEWGIQQTQKVAFYCGTGWRASEVFFYAYVMGWPHISVFDGGWYEWSADQSNPVESGPLKTSRG